MTTSLLNDVCNIDYGTRVVRSRDQGELYDVYGGGGKTFRVDNWNRENSMIVSRFGMSPIAVRFVSGKFFLNDSGLTVSTKNESVINQAYINCFLLFANDQIFSLGRGSAQKNLDIKGFGALKINYPNSIEEQRRIVAKLDAAFEKIDRAIELSRREERYIQAFYNSQLESIFLDQNEAEEVSIEDVCMIKGGKRLPKGSKLINTKTPWPYIRVSDFDHEGGVNVDKIQYLDENTQKQIERYTITEDDVFLSIAGSIGITGIVPPSLNGANLTENACRLIPNEKIDKEYLYFFTRTRSFIEQAAGATRQTAQPKLALIRIKNIHLRLPDINTQKDTVSSLKRISDSVQCLRVNVGERINYLENLRQSMFHEAFTESAVK